MNSIDNRSTGRRIAIALGASGLALGAGVASAGLAAASVPSAKPPTAGLHFKALAGTATTAPGTISGVTSFTMVRGKSKVFTIDLGPTTSFAEVGVTNPTSTDLLAGEHVVVRGEWSATTSTVAATSVRIIPERPHAFPGTVVATAPGTPDGSGNASFTIKRGKHVFTVDVTSTTKYKDAGVTGPTLADVTVGEHVVVWGTSGWPTTMVTAKDVRVTHS